MAAEKDPNVRRHMVFQGLRIAVENPAGSVRRGVDRDGHAWETKMLYPYGYIENTEGNDGDGIDCYVGPSADAPNVFVVHQRKANGKGYDEDKAMLGFPDEESATKAFLAHYDDPKFLGPITTLTVLQLKQRLRKRHGVIKKIANAAPAAFLNELQQILNQTGDMR
jgi:hypothetical protein